MVACLRYLLWSAMALTVVGRATTAPAGPLDDCRTLRGEAALAPCTLVIEDKKESRADRALALLLRAREALDVSDLGRAEADINAAFSLQPATSFAYRIRGRLLGLLGKNKEALADYAKAIQMPVPRPSRYLSYQERGHFLLQIGELPAAQSDFEAAIGLDPTKAPGYVGRAMTYKAMGKISEALADLGRAKAVEPGYLVTYVEQGDILTAEKRYAEAIAAYDLALAIRSDNVRALRGRGAAKSLLNADNTPAPAPTNPPAPTAPRVAAPAAPTTPSASPAPPAAPVIAAPAVPSAPPTPAAQPSTPKVAAPAAPATTSAPPAPPAAPVVADPNAPPPSAAPPVQPSEAVDPNAKQAEERRRQLREAQDLRKKGKHQQALVVYDTLLRQTPDDAEVALEKARTLVELSKWEDALNAFKLVLESKTAAPKMKALAFEGLGEVFARNNVFAMAIQSTTKALELNPKLHAALFWRGRSEYALGGFDKASTDFQEATSILPKSTVYPGWEAIALVSAGDLPKAREAIDRAFAIQADNINALTARARLRLVSGEIDAAEADLAQLKRRGTLNPVALETQQLIMIHKIMKPSDKPPAGGR
jgi:tetratricopeptide (TPR) repeat protein